MNNLRLSKGAELMNRCALPSIVTRSVCVHPVGVQHPYLPLQQTVGPAEPHGTVSATSVVLLVGLNNETECATMNGSAQPFLLLSFLLWSTVVLCQSLLQALYA